MPDRRHFRVRTELLQQVVLREITASARDPAPLLEQLCARLGELLAEVQVAAAEQRRRAEQIPAKQRDQDAVIMLYRRGRGTEAQLDM